MTLLDVSIVNTALPSIQRGLHESFSQLQWVIDAYVLTLAAFLLTSGSLADRLGRRRVFTGGLLPALVAASEGRLAGQKLTWHAGPSVCVVLASAGYPGAYETGKEIRGLQMAEAKGATVFHAGTRVLHGRLETSGGRVLGVTASGPDLPAAIAAAYEGVRHIEFEGMHFRHDIGSKGLGRGPAL